MAGKVRGVLAVAVAGLWAGMGVAGAAAQRSLAPVAQEEAVSTHSPFETGECGFCHEEKRGKKGGKLLRAANELCFDCHEDFRTAVKNHPKNKGSCTVCHSPHNSKKRKLLL